MLGDGLIQIGWCFTLGSKERKGRPCRADHRCPKPRFSHSELSAVGIRASSDICLFNGHSLSAMLLRALGHAAGSPGHRAHTERLSAVGALSRLTLTAAAFPCSPRPRSGHARLQLSVVLFVCMAGDTGHSGKAMGSEGSLCLAQVPGSPLESSPQVFKFTSWRFSSVWYNPYLTGCEN